jgi:hypothetical protein
MHLIRGAAALAVLTDPAFEVPPVPAAETGVGWLRATVARFSSGEAHARRRALTAEIIDRIPAARIGILVQACDATATLIARTRNRPLRDVLRDDPPVRATRRRAGAAITVDGVQIEEGETVLVELAADLAFGAGPHRCPGQWLALAAARR